MPEKAPPDTSKLLLCPMPGQVKAIHVAVGQEVKGGEALCVVEAMKMENVLRAERDATVKALAECGVKNLAVITPGFAADCLETLEEIAMENAEIFRHAGGENFAAIPCLNDSPGGMAAIRDVVTRELQGWS